MAAEFDLALAVTLETLLRERSVTRAARVLRRSQPAISRELAALRSQLGDPLLVRTSGSLTLTPRAEQLLGELPHALARLRSVLAGAAFDPATATGTYRVSMSDYEAAVLLPRILALLDAQAPSIRLAIVQRHRPVVEAALNSGDVALAIGRFVRPGPLLHHQGLFEDDFVLIADRDRHDPTSLSDPTYVLGVPFVLVAPGNTGDVRGLIDEQLNASGQRRFVRLSTPHFASLPGLITGQRAVAFAPRRLLSALALPASLQVLSSPLSAEPFGVGLLWHQRNHRDAASEWLRALFVQAATM